MYFHQLKPAPGARKRRKIVGRGHGSGHGKTSGRGHKGQKARSGGTKGPGFQGGQMTLSRRLPKRGFRRPTAEIQIVNIEQLTKFKEGTAVTPEVLKLKRLIANDRLAVKVLGNGKMTKALTIKAHSFSKSAEEKIKAAGGQIELINA